MPRELLFIKSGVLSMTATDADGGETTSTLRGPRSLLGFEALRGQPASNTVRAVTDAVLCAAPPDSAQRLGSEMTASECARQTEVLWELTLDELLRVERDSSLRSGPALARVARFLLMGSNLIEPGRHTPFSKSKVAALLGLRPETMSRCLTELKGMGAIADGQRLEVKDRTALAELSR